MSSTVGKSVFKLLGDAAAVTAIVGTSPKRIYPIRMPQTRNFPAIVFQQITSDPTGQKDGVTGYHKIDFDIDCYTKTFSQAVTLAAAVRTALERQSISTEGDVVDDIIFIREFDNYQDQAELYQKTLQFRFIVIG